MLQDCGLIARALLAGQGRAEAGAVRLFGFSPDLAAEAERASDVVLAGPAELYGQVRM